MCQALFKAFHKYELISTSQQLYGVDGITIPVFSEKEAKSFAHSLRDIVGESGFKPGQSRIQALRLCSLLCQGKHPLH